MDKYKEASTAIPQLLHWCENNEVAIESINEFVPPFDDLFVKIMEEEQAAEEEQVREETTA